MGATENERGLLEGLSKRTALLAELSPKFSDVAYTEGTGVKCSIDKMDNGKWCVYHFANMGQKAGKSYRVYKELDSFYKDFDLMQTFRAKAKSVK